MPADVDALTGYRRYAVAQVRAARLLASLRRVGMPLAEVALVLDEDARGAVRRGGRRRAAHEQRLVDGLRRRAARDRAHPRPPRRARQPGGRRVLPCVGPARRRAGDLAAALGVRPVRRRAGGAGGGRPRRGGPARADRDPRGGVRRRGAVRRHRPLPPRRRMGCPSSAPPAASRGRPVGASCPLDWADLVADACAACRRRTPTSSVELGRGGWARRSAASWHRDHGAAGLVPGLPEHRRHADAGRARGSTPRGSGRCCRSRRESVGLVVRDGSVHLAAAARAPSDVADVLVDPEFLREALSVAGPRPTLVLDGPRRPLAIRGDGAGFSVLMPVAPEGLGVSVLVHLCRGCGHQRRGTRAATAATPRAGAAAPGRRTPTPRRRCCPRRRSPDGIPEPLWQPAPSATWARCTPRGPVAVRPATRPPQGITRREHPSVAPRLEGLSGR